MKKLLRVVRSKYTPDVNIHAEGIRLRTLPMAILPARLLEIERSDFLRDGEFFLVEERDVDNMLMAFAQGNPGCEIQIWNHEASAECPAAPMVVKKVTPDGVLPV